jgi:hypothetical protein
MGGRVAGYCRCAKSRTGHDSASGSGVDSFGLVSTPPIVNSPSETSPDGQRVGVRQDSARQGAPALVVLLMVLAILSSIGVCMAAVIARAPAAVAPLVALVCVGCPLVAGWEFPAAMKEIAARRGHGRALAGLRQALDRLPETEHPLGL